MHENAIRDRVLDDRRFSNGAAQLEAFGPKQSRRVPDNIAEGEKSGCFRDRVRSNCAASVRQGGGRPIASGVPVAIEATAPKNRAVINQWDSMEQLQAWYKGAEYQKARDIAGVRCENMRVSA